MNIISLLDTHKRTQKNHIIIEANTLNEEKNNKLNNQKLQIDILLSFDRFFFLNNNSNVN